MIYSRWWAPHTVSTVESIPFRDLDYPDRDLFNQIIFIIQTASIDPL